MTTRKKLSSPALYSIAWVAALPIERAAATALLNERHDEPEGFDQHASDTNAYDWGEIGQHNVVIASLPAGVYGTTSAVITASHLLSSLPHIRIGLLVGIGGGIPHLDRDIRLGDIVVSQPVGQNGGVVQYDLGKAKLNQTWERKGVLNMPPTVLLNALGKLQADHEIEDPRITDLLQGLIEKYPRMKAHYVYQGEENDRLFSPDYEHAGGSTCAACDSSQEVKRSERETTDLEIHYGTVASGNTLVKDAKVRDIILQRVGEECLCVEMEAAGLMNTFPCLVIRGICDYADSHKNDRWQRYAAATAAAFAVQLLGYVPAKQLQEAPSALKLMESIATVGHTVTSLKETLESRNSTTILDKLPVARGAAHDSYDSSLQSTCLENTRVDVLRGIYEWAQDPNSTTMFWLNGMAGTGKSTISRTVAHSLGRAGTLGGSFFFKKGEAERGNPSKLFTTLAAGLSRWQSPVSRHIGEAIDQNPQIFDQMLHQQFSKLILEPLSKATLPSDSPIVMVIDALDECQHHLITSIIADIFPRARSLRHPQLKFFLTSRPELPIQAGFQIIGRKSIYQDMILQNVSQDVIRQDLEVFFTETIAGIGNGYNNGLSRLPPNWPGKDTIQRLVEMAFPLFIAASTICRFLEDRHLGNSKRQMDKILAVKDRAHGPMLDQIYLAVLNQQLEGGLNSYTPQQKSQILEEFRLMVGSIILLSTPLTIPALAQLLHGDQDVSDFQETLENRLELLHSVLSVPPPSERLHSPVRALHLSFRDFLVDGQRRDANPFWVDETKTHGVLAQCCLKAMRNSLRNNMCQLKHPGIRKRTIYRGTVDLFLPSHVQYACAHWIDHLELAEVDSTTGDAILKFLETHLLHWLEALSLIDRVLESVQLLERLKHVTMNIGCSRLSMFLEDSARFAGENSKTLALAPLQVYSSALVFAPLQSIVRTTFHTHIPDWISLQPRVRDQWGNCIQRFNVPELGSPCCRVVFSPDSKLIAYITKAADVLVWDVKTGAEVLMERTDDPEALRWCSVVFSVDSALLFIVSHQHIRAWRVATGEYSLKLYHPQSHVSSMILPAPGLIASGSATGEIRVWEVETGRLISILEGHSGPINSFAVSADQKLLVSGSDDGKVIVWQMDTWVHLKTLTPSRGGAILRVALSSDSTLIAAAIYDPDNWKDTDDTDNRSDTNGMDESDEEMYNETPVTLAVFSINGDQESRVLAKLADTPDFWFRSGLVLVVLESSMLEVSVWQADTGHMSHELRSKIWCYATKVSSDLTLAFSTWSGECIEIWDIDSGECLQRLDIRHGSDQSSVRALAVSTDKKLVVSAMEEYGGVSVWQTNLDKESCLQTSDNDIGYCCAISPDLSLSVFALPESSTLTVWETTTGKCRHRLEREYPSQEVLQFRQNTVFFSHDSKVLFSNGRRLLIWDIETGTQLLALESPPKHGFYWAQSSPSQELIATGCPKGMQIWQIATGECIQTIESSPELHFRPRAMFSPDSALLAAVGPRGAHVWNVSTGRLLLTIPTPEMYSSSVAISANRELIAIQGLVGVCGVWRISNGDCIGFFETGVTFFEDTVLSFEDHDTQILTNLGLMRLDEPHHPVFHPMDWLRMEKVGMKFKTREDGRWITWYGNDLLLVPNEYSRPRFKVLMSSVLLETMSRRVIVMGFEPNILESMSLDCK